MTIPRSSDVRRREAERQSDGTAVLRERVRQGDKFAAALLGLYTDPAAERIALIVGLQKTLGPEWIVIGGVGYFGPEIGVYAKDGPTYAIRELGPASTSRYRCHFSFGDGSTRGFDTLRDAVRWVVENRESL